MGEWIKCSERLPDDSKQVLVFVEAGYTCISNYWDGEWSNPSDDPECFDEITPSHWQPLPEPPEQQ